MKKKLFSGGVSYLNLVYVIIWGEKLVGSNVSCLNLVFAFRYGEKKSLLSKFISKYGMCFGMGK